MTLKRLNPAARLMGNGGLHLQWHLGDHDAIHERGQYAVGKLTEDHAANEYTIHHLGEKHREYSLYYKDDEDVAYCSCPGFFFHSTGRRPGATVGKPCKHLMLIRHLALRGELPDGPVHWSRQETVARKTARRMKP